MIRVFVAEDEALVRQGICTLLELDEEFKVVGTVADGQAALAFLTEHEEVDVAVLDVRMPRLTGIEVVRCLAELQRATPCLILTTFDNREVLLDGIRAGARGYLRKDVSVEQLSAAIRALAAGNTFFHPACTKSLLTGLERLQANAEEDDLSYVLAPLTTREQEVMRLVAGGFSNKEIASALGTADGTIKAHMSSILSKLGVRDRVQAVVKVLEAGLV